MERYDIQLYRFIRHDEATGAIGLSLQISDANGSSIDLRHFTVRNSHFVLPKCGTNSKECFFIPKRPFLTGKVSGTVQLVRIATTNHDPQILGAPSSTDTFVTCQSV
jgi:hypothetical protein